MGREGFSSAQTRRGAMKRKVDSMSINVLEFAQNMTKELDKAAEQKAVTGFLADNALRARFVGANKVLIPEVEISGLGDYDRDTGFVTGTITVSSTPYTLSMDRGRSFQLDREDNDETGIANLAGQVMGEFVRTRVVPEVDAYCLSKLSAFAAGQSQTVTGTPATGAYAMLTGAIHKAQNVVGYQQRLPPGLSERGRNLHRQPKQRPGRFRQRGAPGGNPHGDGGKRGGFGPGNRYRGAGRRYP